MPLYKNTDLEALRQHLPVKGSFDINLLLTVVHDVEEEHIIPALGVAQYDELNDAYAALVPPAELFPALGALLEGTEEYLVVQEGSGTLTIDGVEHAIAPGTSITMPAGAEVSYVNGPQPFRALQVFAGPGPAAKYERWTPVPADP